MRYLLIVTIIALILTTTANARDVQFNQDRDQLHMVAVSAGTYLLGNILEDHFNLSKTEAYISSGLLIGTGLLIYDYYGDKSLERHKNQATAIGVGFAWTISLGFGL